MRVTTSDLLSAVITMDNNIFAWHCYIAMKNLSYSSLHVF